LSKRHRPREHVYVVVRADLYHGPDTPLEMLVTTKAVLRSRKAADSEVARLNALHPDGSVQYWCSLSRLYEDDVSG
jgi:hypothetical protein